MMRYRLRRFFRQSFAEASWALGAVGTLVVCLATPVPAVRFLAPKLPTGPLYVGRAGRRRR